MQIRAVIVEDEIPSLERLKDLMKQFPEITIVGEAHDGQEAVDLINKVNPDLAFLDIHLPVFSSFDVLEKIDKIPHTIFVTAYDQYAVDAFEKNAVDYLLKPTTKERLQQAIEKVKRRKSTVDENLLEILKSSISKKNEPQRFCVKLPSEILFVPKEEIYFFKAEDKYVFLNTFSKEYIYDATLKELEGELESAEFLRIHKSVIISTNKIQKIKKQLSGKYSVILTNEKKSRFEISRTYLPIVKDVLKF